MKTGLLAGLGTFAVAVALLIFTVPGVFNMISGLFDDNTVGSIAALAVTAIYVYIVAQVALVASVLIGGFVGAIKETADMSKRRKNRGF